MIWRRKKSTPVVQGNIPGERKCKKWVLSRNELGTLEKEGRW